MAKRYTQTEIWEEDWFLEMPRSYMLFWFFIKDKCNHAGIWRPNVRYFNTIIDGKISLDQALVYFNYGKERIQILKSGHWFILDFFVFQYGSSFNTLNKVHKSIESIYNQEDIELTSIRGLLDLKDRVKDKDKEKDNKEGKNKKEKIDKDLELIKNLDILESFHGIFLNWLHYKRERNQSYKTKDSAFLAYKRLLKLSNEDPNKAMEAVEYSMANNYSGIFESKEISSKLPPTIGQKRADGAQWKKCPDDKFHWVKFDDNGARYIEDSEGVFRRAGGTPWID